MASIGDQIIFVDSLGRDRPALVTNVWGDLTKPNHGVNLVYVNDDENQTDSYGRKLERATSVVHRENQPAHGYYWKEV